MLCLHLKKLLNYTRALSGMLVIYKIHKWFKKGIFFGCIQDITLKKTL